MYVNDINEVLLVRQYRPIFSDYFLELPGGSRDLGEPIEQSALREFLEETGFNAINIKLMLSIILSIGSSSERVHIFEAEAVEAKASEPEVGIEPVWINITEVGKMITQGLIVDAKTIVALQALLLRR